MDINEKSFFSMYQLKVMSYWKVGLKLCYLIYKKHEYCHTLILDTCRVISHHLQLIKVIKATSYKSLEIIKQEGNDIPMIRNCLQC